MPSAYVQAGCMRVPAGIKEIISLFIYIDFVVSPTPVLLRELT